MKFSSRCDYALRVMLDLAVNRSPSRDSRGKCATTEDIARRLKIPFKYLQHIIRVLKSEGYVATRLGEGGGVYLAKNPAHITVGQIVRLIDGPIVPMSCAVAAGKKNECRVIRECFFKPLWQEVKNKIDGTLDSATFGELADKHRKLSSARMYHI